MIKYNTYCNNIIETLLRVRIGQLLTNEMYKKGAFKVPIHLALGHEAIAASVDAVMTPDDQLVLSHRNIHYNLARTGSLRPLINEYLLTPQGIASGELGSMNLTNPDKGIFYTSSILANNLSVATGLAMGQAIKGEKGVVFVVTGDGAIEEGAFYESLIFEKSNNLPVIILIENNQWSLATRIEERRCPIDISKIAHSLGAGYELFHSNDVFDYFQCLQNIRNKAAYNQSPICVEILLTTLGGRWVPATESSGERFINYHAGAIAHIGIENGPVIEESVNDPIKILEKYIGRERLENLYRENIRLIQEEIE